MTDAIDTQQRRHLSRKVESISSSGIRRFFELIANMDGCISLGVGEPDFVTPERLHPEPPSTRSLARRDPLHLQLRPPRAARSHRRPPRSASTASATTPRREIIVTIGVSEALLLATHALLDPGDEVLSPDPYYVAYLPCASSPAAPSSRCRPPSRTTSESPPPTSKRASPHRTKAILLGYPSNPTGAQMTREDLADIADVAARHDLIVISDEIYDRLVYGIEHTCFASLPGMKERTILLGGFSKAYAMTGWRVGWVCAPPDILEAMMKIHQYIIMSAPTPVPVRRPRGDPQRRGRRTRQDFVAEFDRRRRLIVDGLRDIGLALIEPHGAFYAFPSIRSTGTGRPRVRRAPPRRREGRRHPRLCVRRVRRGHVRMCYASPYNPPRRSAGAHRTLRPPSLLKPQPFLNTRRQSPGSSHAVL